MIRCQGLRQRGSLMHQIVIVSVLRPKNGRLKQSAIAKPMNAAKFLDQMSLHFKGFTKARPNPDNSRLFLLRWNSTRKDQTLEVLYLLAGVISIFRNCTRPFSLPCK